MMMPLARIARATRHAAWLAWSLILLCSPASARWKPDVEVRPHKAGVLLTLDHHPAMLFEHVDAAWSVPGRPQLVARRLQNLIEIGLEPKMIGIRDSGSGAIIVANGAELLTVTESEAHSKRMTPRALAETWARTLKRLLGSPPLTLNPDSVVIPMGESRRLAIGGAAGGPYLMAVSPEGVVHANIDPVRRQIDLLGAAPGDATVTVSVEGVSETVPIKVRRYAGETHAGRIVVTGHGPERAVLQGLILDAVERGLLLQAGAVAHLPERVTLPDRLPAGNFTVRVPVSLDGDAYLPVRTAVPVNIGHEVVNRTEPDLLFYSNRPEMLRRYGTLFTGEIRKGQAVRLLYHHQSTLSHPIRFIVQLKNGASHSRLQIIDGAAAPMVDTLQIGDRAAARFFPAWLSDSGYIQEMDPNETVTLINQRLGHDDTTSGLFHFVLLEGSETQVQIRADAPDDPDQFLAARFNLEVYPVTRRKIDETYAVGGRWSFIPFGRDPVTRSDSTHPLLGNYGIVYDIHVKLTNPTATTSDAEIVFDPAAGVARGVFIVDGHLQETNLLQPPAEYLLASCRLDPGQSRAVHIVTMPLAGSNYPARFVVRPRCCTTASR